MVIEMQQAVSTHRDKSRSAKQHIIVDSDELQMMDERNRKWVDSWKKAVKQ